MNTLISIPIEDLSALRDAVLQAKNNALYNEQRCRELRQGCTSPDLVSSLFRAEQLSHDEYLKYQRLLNKFSF